VSRPAGMTPRSPCVHAILRRTARGGAVLWAAAWAAFAVLAAASDGPASFPYVAAMLAVMGILLGTLWRSPRVGGILAIALSLAAAFYFRHPAARLFFAVPPLLFGIASILSTSRLERGACDGHVEGGSSGGGDESS
jgi:hypothetical protein